MKVNRKWLLLVALVLSVAMATTGTLAYLTDEDADVNTMVLGKVEIVQNEQEWRDNGVLDQFTQDKPLYPAVGELGWENTEMAGGAYRRFTMNNVVDKYVSVTNTGKSPAYVRTIIALEMGDVAYEELGKLIGVSVNAKDGDEFDFPGTWEWTHDFFTQINGKNYNIMVAVHEDALEPGETTIPSLNQVYLNKIADNEDVEALDGNDNGKYDILVISQAIQANGFEDLGAQVALEEGFPMGKDNANVAGWFESIGKEGGIEVGSPGDKNDTNNPPEFLANVTVYDDASDTLTVTKDNGSSATLIDEELTISAVNVPGWSTAKELELDVAYQFQPAITADEAEDHKYRYWHADFVVSTDQNIPAEALGLVGYYQLYCDSQVAGNWIMMYDDKTTEAGTEIRLVEALGATVNFEELCNFGNDGIGFLCGVAALEGEMKENGEAITAKVPAGTNITVELRLYETEEPSPDNGNSHNVETGKYITVGYYTYTFN